MMYSARVIREGANPLFVITAADAEAAYNEVCRFLRLTHWQGFIQGTCQPATPQEVQMADYALFAENDLPKQNSEGIDPSPVYSSSDGVTNPPS
jgi:hypothetical protein